MTSGNKGVQVLLEYRFGICLVVTKLRTRKYWEILAVFVNFVRRRIKINASLQVNRRRGRRVLDPLSVHLSIIDSPMFNTRSRTKGAIFAISSKFGTKSSKVMMARHTHTHTHIHTRTRVIRYQNATMIVE